jgi:hypothetical protein
MDKLRGYCSRNAKEEIISTGRGMSPSCTTLSSVRCLQTLKDFTKQQLVTLALARLGTFKVQ